MAVRKRLKYFGLDFACSIENVATEAKIFRNGECGASTLGSNLFACVSASYLWINGTLADRYRSYRFGPKGCDNSVAPRKELGSLSQLFHGCW